MSDLTRERDVNRSALWARVIIEELVAAGVRDFCISPGSRSTPLTLAAISRPDVRIHSHIDERSSAFFALGCAKSTGRPAALICTSGSAGAHYFPAIIEANYARIPLVALTADRPFELMHTGAGQTIEQAGFFTNHIREELHLETPAVDGQSLRHLRVSVARVVARSLGRAGSASPGPVHLNVPFQEPLAPLPTPGDPPEELYTRDADAVFGRGVPYIDFAPPHHGVSADLLEQISARVRSARRGVIVCGPHEPTHDADGLGEALAQLAEATGFPLLVDPVSGAKFAAGSDAVTPYYDGILRARAWAGAMSPELVIRFGAQPTSKVYRFWREDHPGAHELLVDPFGDAFDHVQQARTLVQAPSVSFATALAARVRGECEVDADWSAAWRLADEVSRQNVSRETQAAELWEAGIASDVVELLPEESLLFIASSMPIRDFDAFAPATEKPLLAMANRGANGIDGLVACALGASSASGRSGALVIGDVAFLHDASSLLIAARGTDPRFPAELTIVVVNNGGGGIFTYLPIANFPEHFERHFLTTHEVDVAGLCAAYGVEHSVVDSREAFREAFAQAPGGVRVLEVIVDRESNVARHRATWGRIAEQLDAVAGGLSFDKQ